MDIMINMSTTENPLNLSGEFGIKANNSSNSSWVNGSIYECTPLIETAHNVDYSWMVLEFAKILYGLVFLVGLFGNSLVIYVV